MNIHRFVLLAAFVGGTLLGQSAEDPATVIRRVADNVLRNTSFTLVHGKTGERWTTMESVPEDPEIRVESPYNQWEYWNGVLAVGLTRLGKTLPEPSYTDYAKRNYRFIFDRLDYFRRQYEVKRNRASFFQHFRLSMLDDCGAMAAGLSDVNEIDPHPEYAAYLKRAADYIMEKQDRLPDGTLVRPSPRKMTLWADDLYMSVPFLARMGRTTGDRRYFDDAIRQVENFNRYLYEPANGLFYHCWFSAAEFPGVAHWGRCNGWVLMAQVELLGQLPADHPRRADLTRLLLRQIVGLSRYQAQSGRWYQLLDKPDSYEESSCTAMFVYGIARAVNEGWIHANYLSIARRGWEGLVEKIDKEGQVQDICIGTGIRDDLNYYYTRPTKLHDIHGIGAVLLAGLEMTKATKK